MFLFTKGAQLPITSVGGPQPQLVPLAYMDVAIPAVFDALSSVKLPLQPRLARLT